MFCPKCGTDNDDDAKYCEGCGRSLQKGIHEQNIQNKQKNESSGMGNGVKALIVICVVLVAGIGITAGMLLQNPSSSVANNSKQDHVITTTQSSDTQTYQPTWHKVAVYTGPGEDYGSFTIKGNQFKVTMSAVPAITYTTNYLDVYVYEGNTIGINTVGSGTLSWSETENPDKKEDSILVSQGSGIYTLDILPTDIDNYAVTVWDYY
jgi:Predicted membrane protein